MSRICGDWDAPATSLSTARGNGTAGGRTYTASTKRERILDVSTLGALPASRAVVMLSGTYPLVARKGVRLRRSDSHESWVWPVSR